MRKRLIPIFFALTTLWPNVSQAITQTTAFTLSVTIPESAGTSTPARETESRVEPSTPQPASVQRDEVLRENQVVLLESYVTK